MNANDSNCSGFGSSMGNFQPQKNSVSLASVENQSQFCQKQRQTPLIVKNNVNDEGANFKRQDKPSNAQPVMGNLIVNPKANCDVINKTLNQRFMILGLVIAIIEVLFMYFSGNQFGICEI